MERKKINNLWKLAKSASKDIDVGTQRNFLVSNIYIYAYENNLLQNLDNDLYNAAKAFNKYLSKEVFDNLQAQLSNYDFGDLQEFIEFSLYENNYFDKYTESSSETIAELVYELLDIRSDNEFIYDMGSGNGAFLAKVVEKSREKGIYLKNITGTEISVNDALVSQMGFEIVNNNQSHIDIHIGNALENNVKFSRGFVFPPLCLKRVLDKPRNSKLFSDIVFSNKNTAEWIFIDQLLSNATDNFRAVAVVSGRALFNDADKEFRNRIIQNGLLEGIIELPIGSLSYISNKIYLLVFAITDCTVKLLDASKIYSDLPYKPGKLDIREIISLYKSNNVPERSSGELISLNNILPSSVLLDVTNPENGIRLSEIAYVFTGNQYTLGVFDKNHLLTSDSTGYRILTSGDINNGIIEWDELRSIIYNDDKFDKYAVRKNDIIVSSKSSKIKTAVVDVSLNEKVLVIGGMIIIRPNANVINPTYLKMYLDSEQGQLALKRIQKGTTIVSINASDLSGIVVPLIDMDKQLAMAKLYNDRLSTIYALKKEVKRLEESLKEIYIEAREIY